MKMVLQVGTWKLHLYRESKASLLKFCLSEFRRVSGNLYFYKALQIILMISQVFTREFLLTYYSHGELSFWLNPKR